MDKDIQFPGQFGFALWGIRLDTAEPTWHPVMRIFPGMFEYWVPAAKASS